MNHSRENSSERRGERPEAKERRAAPPIEREHETYAGVFEEDEGEHRERVREER